MKAIFFRNDRPREILISRALSEGLKIFGDELEIRSVNDYGEGKKYEGPADDVDVMLCYGVKSSELVKDHIAVKAPYIYIDKGYFRHKDPLNPAMELYSRMSVNEFQPLSYFQEKKNPSDRFDRLGMSIKRKRFDHRNNVIVFCSSSQKFYEYHGIGNLEDHDRKVIRRLRKTMSALKDRDLFRNIVYRPKPSYVKRHLKDSTDALGATWFSGPTDRLSRWLSKTHVVVTFASNSALEAILEGVPVYAYGPTIARPMCETEIENINDPFFPSDKNRYQWAYDMAYHQWTLEEMKSGEAWENLRQRITKVLSTAAV